MFVPTAEFDKAYEQIKQSALRADCTVLVCCAPDVDALCACAMLTKLLKFDFIPYKIIPIADFDDLKVVKEEVEENPGKAKSLILLNAGGTVDLAEFFDSGPGQPNEGLRFYVLDSHRPLDLDNIYNDDGSILIFDDGQTMPTVPSRDEVTAFDSQDEESGDDFGNSKRRKVGEEPLSPGGREEQRKMAHERQMAYYAASYHGASSAYMMYNLVEQLGRTNNELLWWGILGLTDQFVHERVNFSAYLESATAMQSDVARLNGSADEGASDAAGRLTLASKKEFKFMLLRHWSLYESMVHSRYVASRLGVWQQRGSDSLNIMLAKIGVPLKDCRQRFQSMDAKRRNTLLEQLEDAFRDNGLNDVCYLSFLRQREFRTPVSAADVVYSVTALLQSPTIDMAESQAWRDNFFSAFDVLTGDKQDELRQGIDLAIAQENVVLRQVEAIVQTRQSVRRNKTFRYVIIKDDPDQVHFSRPVILRKIGHYILDTYRYGRGDQRKKKCLPLVVAGYIPSSETYMVVGLWANPRDDEFTVSPNEFGANFREAGDRMQARYKSNGFEDAVMEIQSDDLPRFIMSLNAQLVRMS